MAKKLNAMQEKTLNYFYAAKVAYDRAMKAAAVEKEKGYSFLLTVVKESGKNGIMLKDIMHFFEKNGRAGADNYVSLRASIVARLTNLVAQGQLTERLEKIQRRYIEVDDNGDLIEGNMLVEEHEAYRYFAVEPKMIYDEDEEDDEEEDEEDSEDEEDF